MKKEAWEEYLDKEEEDYLRETGQRRKTNGKRKKYNSKPYNQNFEDFKDWVKVLGGIAVFALIVFILPHYMAISNIYDAGQYEAKEAIEDYMVKKGDVDSWGNDLVLKDKSMKKVETDPSREFFGAEQTEELTFIYAFNNKEYTAIVLVERTSSSIFPQLSDWEFYEVISVK